ncbi:hypothetical protein L0244_35590 [bacterium]|nr:hypothetical protein [bacterium]MCI0618331.1 hypothetical protein [bacterium]
MKNEDQSEAGKKHQDVRNVLPTNNVSFEKHAGIINACVNIYGTSEKFNSRSSN